MASSEPGDLRRQLESCLTVLNQLASNITTSAASTQPSSATAAATSLSPDPSIRPSTRSSDPSIRSSDPSINRSSDPSARSASGPSTRSSDPSTWTCSDHAPGSPPTSQPSVRRDPAWGACTPPQNQVVLGPVPSSSLGRSLLSISASAATTAAAGSSGTNITSLPLSTSRPSLYPRIWQEHRDVFRRPTAHTAPINPYRRSREKARVWRHNFLCLASRFSDQVPGPTKKMELKAAGLGEKQLQIALRATAAQLHTKLTTTTFPKLQDSGGYELLRCRQNSRNLIQLDPPPGGHTPETLKEDVGQARIYVRPLQRDLALEPVDQSLPGRMEVPASGVFETCLVCGEQVPIELLSHHLTSCTRSAEDNDGLDMWEPPCSEPLPSLCPRSTPPDFTRAAVCISNTPISSPGAVCINTVTSPSATGTVLSVTGRRPAVGQTMTSPSLHPLPSMSTAGTDSALSCPPGPSESNFEEPVNCLSVLYDLFPDLESDRAEFLVELYRDDLHEIISCLLDGPSTSAILRQFQEVRLSSSIRHISIRPEHLVEDGIGALFKADHSCSRLQIELEGERPTSDLGGVTRHFFTRFLQEMPQKLNLMEQNGSLYFPTCNADSLIGGQYRRLGELIVNSILQEGPGYPFFPKALYYYFVGGIELAISHLSLEELPLGVEHLVKKILSAESEEELEEVRVSDEYLILSSGILLLLKMSTRERIVQQLMLTAVIYCRKAALDDLGEGLCILRFNEVLQHFPEEFEPLFVAASANRLEVSPASLIAMLKGPECSSEEDERTFTYLKKYISELDFQGCKKFLRFVTGSESIPPIGFSRPKTTVSFTSTSSAVQASTCFNSLTLPHFSSYPLFCSCFGAAVNSDDFNTL